jgi:glycosyltransferase involved in cell wall biosynthesis
VRLLVISQYFWPEDFRINDLVAELVARKHEVTVLTGLPNYPEGFVSPAFLAAPQSFMSHAGACIVRVPMVPRGTARLGLILNYLSFAISGSLIGSWRLRRKEFDAILVFAPSPITVALPAVLLRRLKRAPLLLWVLDLWPETLDAVGAVRSSTVLRLVGKMVDFIYRHSDRILVQSRSFINSVNARAGDNARTRYFPGWAEAVFQEPTQTVQVAPELAAYESTFNVVFAGSIGEAQDFPAILDAADHLRHREDIRWLIVGDGRAAHAVRAEIERRSLERSVKLLGRHPIERMPSFFKAASALLVSLRANAVFSLTIPGKIQPYLAAGVPLLGMLDGEGARVIEDSGAGFVCAAGDGRALALRVDQLSQLSPAERARMGERGKAYARLEFDRNVLIDRLDQWIAEVAKS